MALLAVTVTVAVTVAVAGSLRLLTASGGRYLDVLLLGATTVKPLGALTSSSRGALLPLPRWLPLVFVFASLAIIVPFLTTAAVARFHGASFDREEGAIGGTALPVPRASNDEDRHGHGENAGNDGGVRTNGRGRRGQESGMICTREAAEEQRRCFR